MFDTFGKSKQNLNLDVYRDKVLGCWTGKNIGGTLGAPFEGQRTTNDASFYTQDLKGKPAPNDDLDLQLIWLMAAETNGLYRVNERVLGEHWLTYITGPWNEYGVCKSNIRNGLLPPLSGSCNNDRWKYSNGAWIRSEIWACLLPASPDEAAMFAYYDSCCDHCGEGIYAEIFTVTIQSAAFVISDVRKLINIGLAKIPADCRVARSVKLACEYYDKGHDFLTTREALVKDSEDLGWFQAPANIGFVIVGLLYGEGDFGKSICIANNCGDDTDCTAGTVGALLGIISGRSGIPQKWIEPIGESIQTCSICTYARNSYNTIPATLDELTDRVVKLALMTGEENCTLPRITQEKCRVEEEYLNTFFDSKAIEKRIWNKSPYELTFDLPYARLYVDYDKGPEIQSGTPKKITLRMGHTMMIEQVVSLKICVPESWTVMPCPEVVFTIKHSNYNQIEMEITPGVLKHAYEFIPVEIRAADRLYPVTVHIPLQCQNTVKHSSDVVFQDFHDIRNRSLSRNN